MTSDSKRLDNRDDRDAIVAIFYKMGAAMDRKDWDAYESIFTEDASAEFTEGYFCKGRPEVVGLVREAINACGHTHHMVANFEIELDGDRASASCNVRAHHCGSGDKAHLFQESLSFFNGRFRRTNDGWRIEYLEEKVPIILGTTDIFPTVKA